MYTLRMNRCNTISFLWFYGLCLAVQLGGSYFTSMGVERWYPALEKSPLNPPGIVFGVVWTLLYFLMAIAATRICIRIGNYTNRAIRWWAIQLLLGFIWCILFFGLQGMLAGLIIICAATLAAIVATVLFWRHDDLAGLLMLPLVLWLTLATHLNLYIYLHN